MLNPNDAQTLVMLLQLSTLAKNADESRLQKILNDEALRFYEDHSDKVIVEPKIVSIKDAVFES